MYNPNSASLFAVVLMMNYCFFHSFLAVFTLSINRVVATVLLNYLLQCFMHVTRQAAIRLFLLEPGALDQGSAVPRAVLSSN